MFINDEHILLYVFIGILGAFIGFLVGWCNTRLPENKKIFTREIFLEYKTKLKPNYILMLINAICYIAILYIFGIKTEFIGNLPMISYLILAPMLLCVFCIDYKLTIIPNRLNLTMFEVGLVILFIYGLSSFNIVIDNLLGMFIGAGIFLALSVVGKLIAGKDAMGLGDVKLMGALGLIFGTVNIIIITVLSFLIGAIISILIMIKKRSMNEYIPFGPFIVIATFITILVPSQILINSLLTVFTLGMM